LTVLGLNDEEITKEQVDRFLPVTSLSNEASRPAAMLPPVEPESLEDLIRLANSLRLNKSNLANLLGISRTTLWRRLSKRGRDAHEV
jgi:transcriptional regulator of acetoin/glycerol metabolism